MKKIFTLLILMFALLLPLTAIADDECWNNTLPMGNGKALCSRNPTTHKDISLLKMGTSNVVSFFNSLLPETSNGYDLGTPAKIWRALYINTITISQAQGGVIENYAALVALGTNQATCAPMISTIAGVTAADGTVGVCLPANGASFIGRQFIIFNRDVTNALKVYATGSDTITGQAGSTAISVAAKLWLRCYSISATGWVCEKGVTPY